MAQLSPRYKFTYQYGHIHQNKLEEPLTSLIPEKSLTRIYLWVERKLHTLPLTP